MLVSSRLAGCCCPYPGAVVDTAAAMDQFTGAPQYKVFRGVDAFKETTRQVRTSVSCLGYESRFKLLNPLCCVWTFVACAQVLEVDSRAADMKSK